jgi:hypothetical protein
MTTRRVGFGENPETGFTWHGNVHSANFPETQDYNENFRASEPTTKGRNMARKLNNAHSAFGKTVNEAYLVAANQNPIQNYVPDGPTVANTFTNSFSQNNDDRFEHQLASRYGYGYGYENRGGYRKTKRNQKRKKKQSKVKSKRTRSTKNRRKSQRYKRNG